MSLMLTIKIINFAFLFSKIKGFNFNINKVLFTFLSFFNKLSNFIYAFFTFLKKLFLLLL